MAPWSTIVVRMARVSAECGIVRSRSASSKRVLGLLGGLEQEVGIRRRGREFIRVRPTAPLDRRLQLYRHAHGHGTKGRGHPSLGAHSKSPFQSSQEANLALVGKGMTPSLSYRRRKTLDVPEANRRGVGVGASTLALCAIEPNRCLRRLAL